MEQNLKNKKGERKVLQGQQERPRKRERRRYKVKDTRKKALELKSWAILILLRCIRNCGAFVIKLQGQKVTASLALGNAVVA